MDIPTEQRSHQLNFSFDQLEKLSHKIPKLKVALYLYIPTYKEITIWRYQILYFTIWWLSFKQIFVATYLPKIRMDKTFLSQDNIKICREWNSQKTFYHWERLHHSPPSCWWISPPPEACSCSWSATGASSHSCSSSQPRGCPWRPPWVQRGRAPSVPGPCLLKSRGIIANLLQTW